MAGLFSQDWEDAHTLRVLLSHSRGLGPLGAVLARQALAVACNSGLAIARPALDELARRLVASRRLVIDDSDDGSPGWFVVGDKESRHRVWIASADPLEASCDCLDFIGSSLGACAHVLAVLLDGWQRRRTFSIERPVVGWDPIRPLHGAAPALDRIRLNHRAGREVDRISGLFRDGSLVREADPDEHRAVIDALSAFVQTPRIAEPAVATVLAREREILVRGQVDMDRHLTAASAWSVPLFAYQHEGVRRFLESGRLVLADDMGLGKTAQAIAACHVMLASQAIERALIVVPAPLKSQWAAEWRRFSGYEATVVDGPPARRQRLYARRHGVLIVNYELVRRDLVELGLFAPDLIILDEAQRIKNRGTQTARVIKELSAPWRLVLTGTPLENRLDDLVSIVEWVDPLAFEPRWRLEPAHTRRSLDDGDVSGAHGLETIRARIAPCFLRRRRSEVLAQLPPRRDTVIPVPMTVAQFTAHEERARPIAILMAKAARRRPTRDEQQQLQGLLTQQRLICNGLAQLDFVATWPTIVREPPTPRLLAALESPKLGEIRELLDAIAVVQRRKVVVFSQWRRMLQLAAWATGDVLGGAGLSSRYFTGDESLRERATNIAAFHDDPDIAVLWATDAGGVGLNLQHAASCCIDLDLPWNPAVLEQRIARIHRLGQTRAIDVYNLVAVNGIEGRIADIIDDKRSLFDGLLDADVDEVHFQRAARDQFGGRERPQQALPFESESRVG